jgi:hypothetical protein
MLSLRSFDAALAAGAALAAALLFATAFFPPRSLLVLLPLERFLDLITSVLRLIGRGRPFILKKRAQALQRMWVLSCERRQRGVVCGQANVSIETRRRSYHAIKARLGREGEEGKSHLSRTVGTDRLRL